MKHAVRLLALLTLLCCLLPQIPFSMAETEQEARRLTVTVSGSGYDSFAFLSDGNIRSHTTSASTASITLEANEGMASLYLMFDLEPAPYTITDNASGKVLNAGQYEFLHEYVDLATGFGAAPTSVTIQFPKAVRMSEIYAYSAGTLPSNVQVWQPPLDDKADILLLATHGDDDQLYFAGLFPLYAGELGYGVQVAYLTDHRNMTKIRTHEMLNGLWATGVTAYPVFGDFDDFRIDDLQETYNEYAVRGTSRDDLMQYVVTVLRRFNPQVVIGHDFKGEYGHGMHMVYTDLLVEALDYIGDETMYPEIAAKYGVWDVPKTYIHLYKTNPIVIDYDQPLEAFNGKTAFQVTQDYGFPCHASQQGFMFTPWLYGSGCTKENKTITKVTQITKYNPAEFGLYRSTVGEDVLKNDFMENITSYAEQERLEQERLEAERLEQERLEQERLEQERLEAERQEQQAGNLFKPEPDESEPQDGQTENEGKTDPVLTIVLTVGSIVAVVLLILVIFGGKRKPRHQGRYTRK